MTHTSEAITWRMHLSGLLAITLTTTLQRFTAMKPFVPPRWTRAHLHNIRGSLVNANAIIDANSIYRVFLATADESPSGTGPTDSTTLNPIWTHGGARFIIGTPANEGSHRPGVSFDIDVSKHHQAVIQNTGAVMRNPRSWQLWGITNANTTDIQIELELDIDLEWLGPNSNPNQPIVQLDLGINQGDAF